MKQIKKALFTLGAALAMVAPTVAITAPADAAVNKRTCTNATEYNRIAADQTRERVKSIVGNNGAHRYTERTELEVIYEGWGYGDYFFDADLGDFVYVGPANGDYADTDLDGVVDTFVGADYDYVTLIDQVRKYSSCRGFNGGRPTYVWYDNYTYRNADVLSAYGKAKSDPLAGSGLRTAPKDLPQTGVRNGREFVAANEAPGF